MPKGGAREGAGRKAGVPNKATADIKEAAQQYTQEALAVLAKIMKGDEQPAAARVSAASAILDRAFGKPKQALEHGGVDGAPIVPTLNVTIGSAEPKPAS